MVMYIEACESGSMFEGMLNDSLNIYTTTAANAHESSWATYCPGMSPAPPTGFTTCLGDLYSVAWMENRYVCPSVRAVWAASGIPHPLQPAPPALGTSINLLGLGSSSKCHH